jgi:BirA family biotin operon repressor/biotin-[acetyl-CoA-carboxylase] ligase
LSEFVAPPTPEAGAALILDAVWRRRAQRAADGWAPIRAAWLEYAHPLGTALSAGGLAGRFAGLDHDGALLLDVGGDVQRIAAGDVWLAASGGAA